MAKVPTIEALVPTFAMPTLPKLNLPKIDPPAQWMYERLVRKIVEFEEALTPEEEIGARLVSAPGEGVFHIEDVSYWGPDMLIFHGSNTDGRPIQLLQHYTQLSVLLCVLPKAQEEPRRIGFILAQRLTEG
jgi:hypothetical protein